jgi:heme-degrading monooxygenase HmoA
MYAAYVLRSMNPVTREATLAAAAEQFWPALRELPGFRNFFLVEQQDGRTLGIILWESSDHAEAARAMLGAWQARLDGFGHAVIAEGAGAARMV